MGAEFQLKSNRSASATSSIHCKKVGRASRGDEANFARVGAAALVIRGNRSEAGNTSPCVDSQHGIEGAANRIHCARTIAWRGPFPPNRFRGYLPGMSSLAHLSGGVVVGASRRRRGASKRLGVGKRIVGNCRPRSLDNRKLDLSLIRTIAIHSDLIIRAYRGIEGHLTGRGR